MEGWLNWWELTDEQINIGRGKRNSNNCKKKKTFLVALNFLYHVPTGTIKKMIYSFTSDKKTDFMSQMCDFLCHVIRILNLCETDFPKVKQFIKCLACLMTSVLHNHQKSRWDKCRLSSLLKQTNKERKNPHWPRFAFVLCTGWAQRTQMHWFYLL